MRDRIPSGGGRRTSLHAWRSVAAAAIASSIALAPSVARAFKPDTHVYIAQQVLDDARDGRVTIEPFGEFTVDPAALEAILLHPEAFRVGSVGPDGFPDLVGGQLSTHPGAGGWGADEWLKWLLQNASTPRERAFAYGYASHVAGDVFAHTYINGWAGNVFVLQDGPFEEIRHIALEDFMRLHTPAVHGSAGEVIRPWDALDLPEDFVARVLIRSPEAADRYRAVGAYHLSSMYDEWAAVNRAIEKAEALDRAVHDRLDPAKQALDAKQRELQSVIDAVNRFEVCTPEVCVPGGCIPFTDICWDEHCTPQACTSVPDYPDVCWGVAVDPTGTIASYCATIATLQGSIESLKATVDGLEAISTLSTQATLLPLYDWRAALERAMREYVVASRETVVALMQHGAATEPMAAWLRCWGPAFAGVPSSVLTGTCAAQQFLSQVTSGISSIRDGIDGNLGVLAWLVDPAWALDRVVQDEVKPWTERSALHLAGALGDDSTFFKFAQLLLTQYDAASLNAEYAHDASGENLLEIPDIAERVSAEMGLTPDGFGDRYAPVRNAITLSKLALLPAYELNRMVLERGIPATAYGPTLFGDGGQPFDVLLASILSIDGNHQWQELAPPYPRSVGVGPAGSYGRAFDGTNGFRLWQDCAVRKLVFLQVFQGPLSPGLSAVGDQGRRYAGTDADPFPITEGSRVVDVLPPTPDVAPLPVAVGECPFALATVPTATDLCTDGPIAGTTTSPRSFAAPGSYEVSWTYRDDAGNTTTQRQGVQVVDTRPPAISVPPPTTREQATRDGTALTLAPAQAVDACEGPVAVSDDAPATFPLGTTTIHYTARDAAGNTAHATTTVTIVDTRPPVLSGIPEPVTVEQQTLAGTAVKLPLPVATDVCDAAPVVASDAPSVFPLGTTTVHFTATDASGNVGRATTAVTVVDTTPPTISGIVPSRRELWPPNHDMVPVHVAVDVRDTCDVAPACAVVSVASSEPALAVGSGRTAPDFEIIGDLDVLLRAERTGNGAGRVYTVRVRCTDASGNSTGGATTVVVAHDRS